jgi:hypothetical protein
LLLTTSSKVVYKRHRHCVAQAAMFNGSHWVRITHTAVSITEIMPTQPTGVLLSYTVVPLTKQGCVVRCPACDCS